MTEKHKCGSAEKCQFGDLCKPSYDIGGCSHYKKKEQITNEKYLKFCTTEQLADVLWEKINGAFNSGYACCNLKQDKDYVGRYKRFMEWLKQPHNSSK